LAMKIIDLYKKDPSPNMIVYYSGLFRYEIIANQYKNALSSIDSARHYFKNTEPLQEKTFAFPFWVYATVQQQKEKEQTTYDKLFDSVFSIT